MQLSGGEPTLHPEFFQIMDVAKSKPIRHLMINTNGIKIAKDRAFCDRLSQYMPGIEVYLQFDSFEAAALQELRGADLLISTKDRLHYKDKLNGKSYGFQFPALDNPRS